MGKLWLQTSLFPEPCTRSCWYVEEQTVGSMSFKNTCFSSVWIWWNLFCVWGAVIISIILPERQNRFCVLWRFNCRFYELLFSSLCSSFCNASLMFICIYLFNTTGQIKQETFLTDACIPSRKTSSTEHHFQVIGCFILALLLSMCLYILSAEQWNLTFTLKRNALSEPLLNRALKGYWWKQFSLSFECVCMYCVLLYAVVCRGSS